MVFWLAEKGSKIQYEYRGWGSQTHRIPRVLPISAETQLRDYQVESGAEIVLG